MPPWVEQLVTQMPFVSVMGWALFKLQGTLTATQERRVSDIERVLAQVLLVVEQLNTNTAAVKELAEALRQLKPSTAPRAYLSREDTRREPP